MGPLVLKLVLLKLYLYVGQDFLFPSKLFSHLKNSRQQQQQKKPLSCFQKFLCFLFPAGLFRSFFFFSFPLKPWKDYVPLLI